MAEGGVKVTGLREAYAAVEALPTHVTAALKDVAHATADRIKTGYQERLKASTPKAYETADSARVLDESDEKQYVVNVPGHPDEPAGVPGWLEFGTRYATARPALRPAGDAESERYKSAMAAAAENAVKDTI